MCLEAFAAIFSETAHHSASVSVVYILFIPVQISRLLSLNYRRANIVRPSDLLFTQHCTAYHTRLVTERADYDFCILAAVFAVYLLCGLLFQGYQQIVALIAYAAAYAEYVGLEYVYNIRYSCRKILYVFFYNISS